MRTCERHPRTVVVYEVGVGECPLCVAEERVEKLRKELSVEEDGGSENLAGEKALSR